MAFFALKKDLSKCVFDWDAYWRDSNDKNLSVKEWMRRNNSDYYYVYKSDVSPKTHPYTWKHIQSGTVFI